MLFERCIFETGEEDQIFVAVDAFDCGDDPVTFRDILARSDPVPVINDVAITRFLVSFQRAFPEREKVI